MAFDAATLIMSFGYLGVFIASIISSLSLFFPLPGFAVVITAGGFLNPFWVGIAGGIGAAIGELDGYIIGRGLSYGYWKKQNKKKKGRMNKYNDGMMKVIKKWFEKRRGPVIIFLFAVTPLPDDFVIIFCGIIKYDVKKMFLALLAGKIIFSIALAYIGFYGIHIAQGLL